MSFNLATQTTPYLQSSSFGYGVFNGFVIAVKSMMMSKSHSGVQLVHQRPSPALETYGGRDVP